LTKIVEHWTVLLWLDKSSNLNVKPLTQGYLKCTLAYVYGKLFEFLPI